MSTQSSLAKDTAIYGLSSIIGKFLNWCLVPLYTYFLASSADYGIVTNLYAWTALLLVILTYGMETGLFRFLNKGEDNPDTVYSTVLTSLFVTSFLFAFVVSMCADPIAGAMGYSGHSEFISMLAIVVSMDAFGAIPFAYLRYQKKPLKFALLKLFMIFVNIIMNLFFLLGCPAIMKTHPELISWFYDANYGVGYVFVANLISTTCVTLALLPTVFQVKFNFDASLLKRMLKYSLPLLLLGIVGVMNQTIDKILFPYLYADPIEGATQLGIYGACFKVAMVMMVFTQAFRYAYEPFVFAKNRDADSRESYAVTMKYFLITSFLIFLGITFYMDLLKYIIKDTYWEGLVVVPVVLMAYIFQGVYFNLSFWYKLNDKTQYGAYMSLIGCVINVSLIVMLVPMIGYMGAALASLVTYFVMMLISYFWGQKYLPIKYDFKSIGIYFVFAAALYGVSLLFSHCMHTYAGVDNPWINMGFNTVLLLVYLTYLLKKDLPIYKFVSKVN
ncbi:MAG: lipopolysaccharide biosynthesis protein [Paludibacteraceae bacterium]|nr:lipopolysaccharide biosynthesis protein [Paludibacteraceae bacterium]